MANITTARVTIIAESVGAELQHLVDLAADSSYDILSDGYSLTKSGDTWTFNGWGSGRWRYANNVEGYFGNDSAWYGPDSPSRDAFDVLKEAVVRGGGRITFEWSDCDPAMGWISQGTAEFAQTPEDEASGEPTIREARLVDFNEDESVECNLANLMAMFGFSKEEAMEYFDDPDSDHEG